MKLVSGIENLQAAILRFGKPDLDRKVKQQISGNGTNKNHKSYEEFRTLTYNFISDVAIVQFQEYDYSKIRVILLPKERV